MAARFRGLMDIRRVAFFAFAFLFVVSISPAMAQDDDDTADEDATAREVIVSAERSETDLSKAPRAVSIVTGDEIFNNISRTVPEALRYEPGVMVQRTNLGGGAPFVRGLVGNQVLSLVDGIRLNNSTFRGGPNQYLNTIDPFFVDRVEVVRGPGSVLYGSDALGGTINIITRRRKDFSEPFGMDGRMMGRFSTGEREETGHFGADANVRNVAGIAASATTRAFGNIDPGGDEPIQGPFDYTEQDFAGNFDLHLGHMLTWQFSAQHVNLDDVPNYDPANPKNVFEPQRRQMFYSRVILTDLATALDRVELFGSFQRQDEGRERVAAADTGTETRDRDTVDTVGAGLQLESPIGKWVRFIYGGEMYMDDISSTREIVDLGSGDADDARAALPDGAGYLNSAGYLEARFTPLDWLKLVPGARFTYIVPDIDVDDPVLGQETIDEPISDVTWAFHTLFTIARYHGLVAGASRGFRAPSVTEIAKFGPEDGRYDIPNSELDPETLIQYEFGYRVTHPRVFFSLFGFYSDIADLIVRKPTTFEGADAIGADAVHHHENVGEAFIYGGESNVSVNLINRFLEFGGAVSYTLGENETDEEPIRRIPPLVGNTFVKIGSDPVWLEYVTEHAAEQDRLAEGDKTDIRIGPDGTPAFSVHHIRVGIMANEWAQAIIAVENIGDTVYKFHGSGPFEPGRNYKAQVSFIF
ncbi:TonB-dependent receptor [bacterium]|nr:TonB-dependent receptor [bacterium]